MVETQETFVASGTQPQTFFGNRFLANLHYQGKHHKITFLIGFFLIFSVLISF
jgi:hypothetical protein